MRFVSHIRGFSVQVVQPAVRYSNYGDRIVDREMYIAQFSGDLITNDDLDFARRVFEEGGFINGRTTLLDEVTLTPIISRVSVYDTDEEALREKWDPKFKEMVEEFLLERSVNHPDFRPIEEARVEPPWPTYDSFRGTPAKLVEKIAADGYRPEVALTYERQNQNRAEVISALEVEIASQEAEVEDAPKVEA
jgi:hypothetical protein